MQETWRSLLSGSKVPQVVLPCGLLICLLLLAGGRWIQPHTQNGSCTTGADAKLIRIVGHYLP